MAFPSSAVFECRATGDDLNPGGFDPQGSSPGTDYTLQDSPQLTIDGATVTATVHTTTTQITIVGATLDATYNRNTIRISGGTATAGIYFITAVDTVNNRLTLDRSAGTSTQTVQGRIGGAAKFFSSITNGTGSTIVGGNKIWVKSGTYTLTTGTTGPGGPSSFVTLSVVFLIEGYENTRGDLGTKPIFHPGVLTSLTFINFVNRAIVRNLAFDGDNNTSVIAISGGSSNITSYVEYCVAYNFTSAPFAQIRIRNSYVYDSATTGFNTCSPENCGAYNCNVGFTLVSNKAINCWAANCANQGFSTGAGGAILVNCVVNNCGSGGITYSGGGSVTLINCILSNNTGYGFNTGVTLTNYILLRVFRTAFYNNSLGAINTVVPIIYDSITLSADPFIDAANRDFRLNNTVGGGAALKGVGFDPHNQLSYQDIGVTQHLDDFSGTTSGGWS